MEEKHIISSRGKTYYWRCEEATDPRKTLVFLPGLTANHHLFDRQVEAFRGTYSLLVWDAPAHGKSRPYTDFSYAHLAEELKGILDAEGLERVVLIGQSAGGFVAQSFLKRYGEMAEGFLAIGTCPYGTAYYSRLDLFWLRQVEWMARLFPDGLLRKMMANLCAVTPRGRENMRAMLADYTGEELCRLMYLGFAAFIPEVCDLRIGCPVWLVVGDRDRTGKVRRYNRRWHEQTGYPLSLIPQAAHNANDDRPDQVNGVIAAFLDTL